jgi:peptidoglycan/xylan/chitin deacetylase (PgdA/CDA1 family)
MTKRAAALPVLTFHAIDDLPSPISFSSSLFGGALASLHAQGFRTLELRDAVESLRRDEALPPRSVVLTFDDGYRSAYTEAFPVLARYCMTATIFLATGDRPPTSPGERLPRMQAREMLSWSEIREMRSAGLTFGAHTMTHPDLTRQDETEIDRQMRLSRDIIQDALGAPVPCFAYPFGQHDRRSRAAAARHFTCACSDQLGLVAPGNDLWSLPRVDVHYLRFPLWFERLDSPLLAWYLWVRNGPRRTHRQLRSVTRR